MMMEETGDNGSEGELNDDSSVPPDFAVPPGGVQADEDPSSDGGSVTPPSAPLATAPTADPFDFLSMTSVASAPPQNNNQAPVGDFDLFASPAPATAGGENSTPNSTHDLLGGVDTTSSAIDISAQESMISPASAAADAGTSPTLLTAESGDLLGLTGPAPAPAAINLMDEDFQAMPVAAPGPATASADPFANTDLFSAAPVNTDSINLDTIVQQQQQPEQDKAQQVEPPVQQPEPEQSQGTEPEPEQTQQPEPELQQQEPEPPQNISPETEQPQEEELQLAPKREEEAQTQNVEELSAVTAPVEDVKDTSAVESGFPEEPKTDTNPQIDDENAMPEQSAETDTPTQAVSNIVVAADEYMPTEEPAPAEQPSPIANGAEEAPNGDANNATPEPVPDRAPTTIEEIISDDKESAAPSASVPDTPPQSRDVFEEESAVFEEVELASPQISVQEQNAKTSDQETVKVEALSMASLKPPLMDNAPPTPKEGRQRTDGTQAKMSKDMEELLAKAQQEVQDLQKQKAQYEMQHQDSQTETATVLQELQNRLQEEISERAEAENDAKLAKDEIKKLQASLNKKEEQWMEQTVEWKQQLGGLEKENEALIAKARHELEDRKEHERRERVLANKLNNLKKKQATTTDVEDVYEDDLRLLKDEVATKTTKVEELEASTASLEEQLEQEKAASETRIEQLEKAVREEKHLNDERKKKMKSFIEAKGEELREVKAESEHYQSELNHTSQSTVDLNSRWKTLHAQWVQSQTRNRELQRDLNKIKNDSENLHKVGDSLNVKLSRSANETELHKNKRLAAKQELMSVLGQLESEREITSKLRDSVRFTFTAKAQSQHQLLQENLTDFHKQLESLAVRLGRPIPLNNSRGSQSLPSLVMSAVDESEGASEHEDVSSPTNGTNGGQDGASKEQRRILLETTRLLAKLEQETQHISQGIMALTSGIEQMTKLIHGGEKTCFTSLGGIFFGGGLQKAIEADQSGGNRAAPVRYGHSSHLPTEGGTMT